MNPRSASTYAASTRGTLAIVFALAALLFPASTRAADAPGSCASSVASAQNTWLTDTIGSSTDVDWYRFNKPSSGYALVTLGRLPADYDLFLYSSGSCTSAVTSSHRSGRVYDEIYGYLPAGTYYAKVVGYAGASSRSPYALRFRPLSEGVQVLSYAGWTDGSGYRHLAGEILNNTADSRNWIQIDAMLYSSTGVAIGSALGYPDMQTVNPRTRSPFEIVFRITAGYHHSRIAVARSSVTATAIGNLTIAPGAAYTGTVRNNNTGYVRFSEAVTTLYDSYGNVAGLGWGYTNPSTIAPGASAPFKVGASGTTTPNRYAYQTQARSTGCYASPRYSASGPENFASAPTIPRTSAANRVALTFDMGGRMDPAVAILNRLVAYKICATIFPTGAISETTEGQRALAIVKGHPELFELGNHTMNHCDLVRGAGGAPGATEAAYCNALAPSPTEAEVKKELIEGDASIAAYTGRTTKPFWRAPYGSYNSTVLRWAAEAGWTKHFRWDVDTIDWKPISQGGPTARSMALKVVDNANGGSVVLMHLGGYETLDALPAMIDGLRSRGFVLTTLSDMLQ